ncbi:hypothetical protein HID58_080177 [Brassica napus]|uniref:Uncharacterized protein n=1 Tax=Brassica napus TaxID=3708 RepID=A0ABQ7Y473_BRANA|nr:hypothetical protein HID58_080177 [Brassica napus]
MYELSGFNVTRSNNRFKLGDSAVARLNKFTNMVEVPAVANLIPTEMFRFRSTSLLLRWFWRSILALCWLEVSCYTMLSF